MPVSTRKPPSTFSTVAQMAAEAPHCLQERLDGDRREDERNAEPKRIDQEQADALADRVLAGGDGENGPEHRPDAGRPAEGEGEPDDIGADQAGGPRIGVIARLAMQDGDVDHAEEVQAGDDDDRRPRSC